LDGSNLGAQDTAPPYSLLWDTTQTTNGSHTLTAVASDAAGNQTTSAASNVTVNNTDTQAPTTPTGLSATAVSASQINLSWTASTDNVGVVGYKIFRAGTQVGTATTTAYSDSVLAAATLYTYTVSAYDAAGNNSPQSSAASATTQAASQSQGVSGFIPSSRTIDWTTAGIPGGIPSASWPIYQTLSPSGGADDSVAIQTALNAAPAGSVVLLNPGTYILHRASTVCSGFSDDFASGVYEAGLCISKKVVLRGSGPDQTILKYGDGANFISLGQTFLTTANTVFKTIVSGATKGSTQITVQSATGITAGTYLTITQNNPTDSDGNPLVNVTGYTGSCSNCGHGFSNNVMTQMDKVTAVNGNVLTLGTPIYFDYTNSPQFYLEAPMVEYAGLENLRLLPTASSGTGVVFKNINLESCAYCWVHNVESDMAVDRAHVYLSDVYASEISNNYLYDAYSHASGEGYGILIEFRGSQNLIQNNVIRKARHSTVMAGGSGNVWGYNYLIDPYMSDGPNVLPEGRTHGAHPYMNLWEGNSASSIELDFTHGSSSHNTLFRNYYNLTSTNPNTGSPMTNGIEGINIAYFNNYINVVGNAIGQYGGTCTASVYEQNADATQTAAIYNLGYYDDGGTSSPNAALSAKVGQTIVRGGNWDCKTNSVVWSSNVPSGSLVATYLGQQVLPTSLYLSAMPSWFTASGAVWPPIDPSASTKVNKIPAQVCYESGPKSGGAFSPTACYSATGPQPPSSLSAVVH
jgi:hypothetical protein